MSKNVLSLAFLAAGTYFVLGGGKKSKKASSNSFNQSNKYLPEKFDVYLKLSGSGVRERYRGWIPSSNERSTPTIPNKYILLKSMMVNDDVESASYSTDGKNYILIGDFSRLLMSGATDTNDKIYFRYKFKDAGYDDDLDSHISDGIELFFAIEELKYIPKYFFFKIKLKNGHHDIMRIKMNVDDKS